MDEFLKAFLDAMHEDAPREHLQTNLSPMELLVATIHHCWEDHPLRIEQNIFLIALTENLAIDLSDINAINRYDNSYIIRYKTEQPFTTVYAGTPEYEAVKALMGRLAHSAITC